ncbi:hypothetical protein [uncultured Staphylococcus sp.]|uniref:phage baseplate protein n=1 Tax=uncultured Staphylococcus sp. TaxID=189668 RepID=UPI0025F55E94|nr:hypothetical protein [uncultured Staphylococcus sp.]
MDNLVLGHNGDGINEVKDARVDNYGKVHPTLHDRLLTDYQKFSLEKEKLIDKVEKTKKEFKEIEFRFEPDKQEMQFITNLAPLTNAVMQSFWIDSKTGLIYMTQGLAGNSDYMLTRLSPNGAFIDRLKVEGGGHGTHNAYRYIGGSLWIYSHIKDNKGNPKVVRFKYRAGTIKYSDTEEVFTGYSSDKYIVPIYNSKEDYFIFRIENDVNERNRTNVLNYVEIRKATDIDNRVNKVIHRIDIPISYSNNIQPMQGMTYDDGILYWYTGDANPTNPNYLIAFNVKNGEELWKREVTIGGYDKQYLGNFQEAEGLAMYYDKDTERKALLIGVTVGPGNNRQHSIYSVAQRNINDLLKSRATPILATDSGGRVKPLNTQNMNSLTEVNEMGHYYLYAEDTRSITDFPGSKLMNGYGYYLDVLPQNNNGVLRQVLTRNSFGRNKLSFERFINTFTKQASKWSYIQTSGEMWETIPNNITSLEELNIPGLSFYLTTEDTKKISDFPSKYKGVAGWLFTRIKMSEHQYFEELRRNNMTAPAEILIRTVQGNKKSKWYSNKFEEVK